MWQLSPSWSRCESSPPASLLILLAGQGHITAQSHLSHTFTGLWAWCPSTDGQTLFHCKRSKELNIFLCQSFTKALCSFLQCTKACFKPVHIICERHKAVGLLRVHRRTQSSFGRLISRLILSSMKKKGRGYNFEIYVDRCATEKQAGLPKKREPESSKITQNNPIVVIYNWCRITFFVLDHVKQCHSSCQRQLMFDERTRSGLGGIMSNTGIKHQYQRETALLR